MANPIPYQSDFPLDIPQDAVNVLFNKLYKLTIGLQSELIQSFRTPDRTNELLAQLSPDQIDVLVLRCGLDGKAPLRQQSVADLMGIKLHKVAQYEISGLARLRKIIAAEVVVARQ